MTELILAFLAVYVLTIAAALGIRILAQRLAPSVEPRTVSSMAVLGSAVVALFAPRGVAGTHRPGEPETAGSNPAVALATTAHATEDPAERSHPSAPASEESGPGLTGGQPGHRRPRSDAPRHDPASLGRAVERWLS